MKPYLAIFFCLLTFVTFFDCASASDLTASQIVPLEKRYDEAKFYYNQLINNQSLSQNRDNWLKGTRNFRRIYLSSPKSELAPGCLYMLGRIYWEMYDRFQQGVDLQEAISYFHDTARLFPQNRLADDAYFALATLVYEKKNDPQKASSYLTEIVTNYGNQDMVPRAEGLLKQLSQEHDIPLPKIMISSSQDNKLSYVLPVKYWSSEDYTRVVIMASGPVNYKEVLLEETPNAPRRLYIDFTESYIEPQYRAPIPIEDGLLQRIRTGQFSPDTVRVVLDIESIDNYNIYSLPDPFRVVIDVRGKTLPTTPPEPPRKVIVVEKEKIVHPQLADKGSQDQLIRPDRRKRKYATTTSETPPDALPQEVIEDVPVLTLAQQLGLGVRKIVIDPGHGGKDPGAMAFGLKEKDIVLALAKLLAERLRSDIGCEVILTRNDDSFISLEERTAIANTENADLFVSLHVNAHPSAKVRGLETYYLNLTTNAEAMRVAARENATSTHQMSDLQDILSDIMKNSKVTESSRLAQLVHNSILDETPQTFGSLKNLGVKQAPFYVLIGAEMPAILLEIAFISNEEDAANLQNADFITMLTSEITEGIRNYIQNTSAQLTL